ncbi:MAG TPA: sensor domain-containing diguanylate cyclase, partial [Gammaproteobacteria bacterium]|nr:sensor domain-containing diguanylate cyclase [Gammaproteobacteria bacterium]
KDGHIVDIMWSARWSEPDRLRLAVARDITPLKRAQHVRDTLYKISEAAHTADGLPALCEHIHQIVGDLLPVADFTVALFDPASNTVSFPYGADNSTLETQQQQLVPGTLLYQVITSGQALLTTQDKKRVAAKKATRRNSLGIPLVAGRGVIGALLVKETDTGANYSAQEKELLEFVSTQIATVIERKQNETHLLHMAGHDPLTGLPNRALFRDRLDVALSRARRDKEYLALLYLDLNRFKEVNDTYGHDAGDRLLREVARRLSSCLRESDTVARMGGDEFTVLLTNINGADSLPRVVSKVKAALALPFDLDEHSLAVSASIGAALYPTQGETFDQLLRRADTNMYADKRKLPF